MMVNPDGACFGAQQGFAQLTARALGDGSFEDLQESQGLAGAEDGRRWLVGGAVESMHRARGWQQS